MDYKTISRAVISLIIVIVVSSFTFDAPGMKFSPVGSWMYSVPGVPEGYETGTMIVAEDGNNYKVTMQLNEYFKVEADNVVYEKKTLSFSVWVEAEEVEISGTFEDKTFNGTVSFSEGDFDLKAVRKAAE